MCSVYATNSDSPDFFQKINDWTSAAECANIILAGDMNLVLNTGGDCKNRMSNNVQSASRLLAIMDDLGLADIWRILHPNDKIYTRCRKRPTVCLSRIDYFLINNALVQITKDCSIDIATESDHSRLSLTLEAEEMLRGPGQWRFNNRLLNKDKFVTSLITEIQKWRGIYSHITDPMRKWETIKSDIIQFCRNASKQYAHENNIENDKLKEIATFLTNTLQTTTELKYITALEDIKEKIKQLEEEKAKSAAFRARARWIRDGERSTKYFFALEKRNFGQKTMRRLTTPHGVITEQSRILHEQRRFYEELYTSNRDIAFKLTNNTPIFISEKDRIMLDSDISIIEAKEALDDMQPDKAPGCDGITAELMKVIWPYISDILIDNFNTCYQAGFLNDSARRGIITLIPKKKDPSLLKNWRPLTLLNIDYKILAKLFARRMQHVLPYIIGDQQTGFMANRCINENIRQTIDIIADIYQNGKKALIISIDYEKCFDKIEHAAVEGALRYFGFGDCFIRWVKLFFTKLQICTTNSGFCSDFFSKSRGVNQGCPISPYLFLVCGETMAHLIQNNPKIHGIKLGNTTHVLSQFADDTMLFLQYEESTVAETISTLAAVEANTGLVISYEKTTIYRIGSIRDTNAIFYTEKPLQWSSGDIETLGVIIRNGEHQSNKGFEKNIKQMQTVASNWYNRRLSLMAKILVVNTLMGSLFVYKMTILPDLSDEQVRKINEIIQDFIWAGKRPKIPLKVLQSHRKEGGLKLFDVRKKQDSLKLQWIHKLQKDKFQYAYQFLNPLIGDMIWQCNLHATDVITLFRDTFWRDVLRIWCKYHFIPAEKLYNIDIAEQLVIYNSCIRSGNNVFANIKFATVKVADFINDTCSDLGIKYAQEVPISWYEKVQIISALPECWKINLGEVSESSSTVCFGDIVDAKKPVKFMYNYIIRDHACEYIHRYYVKWSTYFTLSYDDYLKLFTKLYKTTNVPRLRSFQYRLLLNKIFPKNMLYKWRIVSNIYCDFCIGEKEHDIEHMLWSCPRAQKIWKYVSIKLLIKVNSFWDVFSNLSSSENVMTSFIILVTKYFLFRCFCQNDTPYPHLLQNELKEIYRMELHNAYSTNKVAVHKRKWKNVQSGIGLLDRCDEALDRTSLTH